MGPKARAYSEQRGNSEARPRHTVPGHGRRGRRRKKNPPPAARAQQPARPGPASEPRRWCEVATSGAPVPVAGAPLTALAYCSAHLGVVWPEPGLAGDRGLTVESPAHAPS
jgi:hypothetical protein